MLTRYVQQLEPFRSRRDFVLFMFGAALVMPLLWAVEGLASQGAHLLGWTAWLKSIGIELFQVWDTVMRGGVVMVAILLCALWMLGLATRQVLTLRIQDSELREYLNEIARGLEPSWKMLRLKSQSRGLLSRVVQNLTEFESTDNYSILSDLLDRALTDASQTFDQQTDRIRFLASAAPRLGLLGTVMGMVVAFHGLGEAGSSAERSAMIANGLAMALGPTTIGLLLGLTGDKIAQMFELAIASKRTSIEKAIRPLLISRCTKPQALPQMYGNNLLLKGVN